MNVIPGDANLRWNIDGLLFQRMLIADDVEKRDQNVKSGALGAAVPAERFVHISALLRYHHSSFGANDDYYDSTHGCLHF